MKFGLILNQEEENAILIDLNTGEILAEDKNSIKNWLTAFENNFTLTLI
jgi:hypothetical protein